MTIAQRTAVTLDAQIEEATRLGYWPFDWPLPSVLSDGILRLVLAMAESTFYAHKKRGAFQKFLVQPAVGNDKYSGVVVDRYRRGEFTFATSFGRKRSA